MVRFRLIKYKIYSDSSLTDINPSNSAVPFKIQKQTASLDLHGEFPNRQFVLLYPGLCYAFTAVGLHRHVDIDDQAFDAAGQAEGDMDRHGLMCPAVRVGLEVIGIRPEKIAVFDPVPGLEAADLRTPPGGRGQDAPGGPDCQQKPLFPERK